MGKIIDKATGKEITKPFWILGTPDFTPSGWGTPVPLSSDNSYIDVPSAQANTDFATTAPADAFILLPQDVSDKIIEVCKAGTKVQWLRSTSGSSNYINVAIVSDDIIANPNNYPAGTRIELTQSRRVDTTHVYADGFRSGNKLLTKITSGGKTLTLQLPLVDVSESMPRTTRTIDNANVKFTNQYKDNQDDNSETEGDGSANGGSYHYIIRNTRNHGDSYKPTHWGPTQLIKNYKAYDNFKITFLVRAMWNYSSSNQAHSSDAKNHMNDYLWATGKRAKTLNDAAFSTTNQGQRAVRVDRWEISGQRQADGTFLFTSKNANHVAQNNSATLPFNQEIKMIEGNNGGEYRMMYGEAGSHSNGKSLGSIFTAQDAWNQTDAGTANDLAFYVVPTFTQKSGQDGLFLSVSDFKFTGQKDA